MTRTVTVRPDQGARHIVWQRIKDNTLPPVDTAAYVYEVGLGDDHGPADWLRPDVEDHPAVNITRVGFIVGGDLRPPDGTYRVWLRITDPDTTETDVFRDEDLTITVISG